MMGHGVVMSNSGDQLFSHAAATVKVMTKKMMRSIRVPQRCRMHRMVVK